MSKHRSRKQFKYHKNLWRHLAKQLRSGLKRVGESFAALLQRAKGRPSSPRRAHMMPSAAPAKNETSPNRAQRTSPSAAQARGRGMQRRRVFRIRDMRRVLIAGGALLAVVITGIVLLVTLTGGNARKTSAQTSQDASSTPAPTKLASLTVAMPVSESVHITEGITAAVVSDVQMRLMDLEYLAADEPDSVFDSQTATAVNHFKTQHNLTADGIVDEQTYSLLMSEEAQYYTLSKGAQDTEEDTDIRELQQRLVELGYMDKSTGNFGDETTEAVKKFQKLNSLGQDGMIGHNTREKLYSEDVVANFYTIGEKSDEILACQQKLKELGYLTTEPDGTFGSNTKAAVKCFQEANGLIADGYLGPATTEMLKSGEAKSSAFSVGDRGEQVSYIQQQLKKLNYFKGNVTGYFGSATETAVVNFQKRNKLTADGKVGRVTMNLLGSSKAKKAASSSSNSGSSSGSTSGNGPAASVTGANVESFISVAESKQGCKYVGGGKGPNTFDCSGFVYWCLNQVGVKQSYMTSYMWRSCSKYTRIEGMENLQRGDVIVFKGHVAICAGGGVMIDASSGNHKVVKRAYVGSSYWKKYFICGYRIF